MITKPTTDNFADDDCEASITDDDWHAEPDAGPDPGNGNVGTPPRKQSALRSIEARRERERLRRELEALDFERGQPVEPD